MLFHLLRRKRLADIAPRPSGERLHHVSFAALCRDHDNRNALRVFNPGKLFDELKSIHDRHVDVAQNKVDGIGLEHSHRFGSIAGLKDVAQVDARLTQGSLHDFSHHRRVVYDESAYRHKTVLDSPREEMSFPSCLVLLVIGGSYQDFR